MAAIHGVIRRLSNFMSSARLYLDQADHDLCVVFGKESNIRERYQSARSAAYDGRLGYRALEALRNFAQHRDIPMHGLSYNSVRKEEDGKSFALHTLRATILLPRIRKEGGFKPSVLTELESDGVEADIKPLVRDYMTGLQAVHTAVREAVAPSESAWLAEIEWARKKVRSALGDPDAKLYELIRRDEADEPLGSMQVFDEFLPRLADLRRKNVALTDLTRQFRSS